MLCNCFICRVSEINTDQKLPMRTSDAVDGSSQTGKYYATSTDLGLCIYMLDRSCIEKYSKQST